MSKSQIKICSSKNSAIEHLRLNRRNLSKNDARNVACQCRLSLHIYFEAAINLYGICTYETISKNGDIWYIVLKIINTYEGIPICDASFTTQIIID